MKLAGDMVPVDSVLTYGTAKVVAYLTMHDAYVSGTFKLGIYGRPYVECWDGRVVPLESTDLVCVISTMTVSE